MTGRMMAVVEVVERFCDEFGYSPTIREIGTIVGLRSSATVQRHVNNAVRKGMLNRLTEPKQQGFTRTIRPVRPRCEVCGRP